MFVKDYWGRLARKLAPYGYELKKLIEAVWAGLQPEDVEYFTTFENSHYCKPNLGYHRQILEKLSLKPEECLMVGNGAQEDMVTEQLGMKVFLLADCLINKENKDISQYPRGGFCSWILS